MVTRSGDEGLGHALLAEPHTSPDLAVDDHCPELGVQRLDRSLERDHDRSAGVLGFADADEVLSQLMDRPVVGHRLVPGPGCDQASARLTTVKWCIPREPRVLAISPKV